ncbi:MAG: F0F1 ATP synthase subunit A [Armatimonadetes bacterium]|nr:F0F1 ATP synthase subunit A [Armatimonadota bacterium]
MEHGQGHGNGLEHGTWLHWLYHYKILPDWLPEVVPETFLVVLVLSAIVILARPRLRTRNPGKLQTFLEFCVTSLDSFVRGIVGEEAKTLTPIIGTFFIFILCLNLLGLIPGLTSPTANINTTVSLAIVAFLIVQFYGIRKQGLVNYLKHFMGEPLALAPLMLPIHLIGELARPLSLSIRLFGNIFGEDMVIAIIILIVTSVLGKFLVPLQFPMLIFAIFTSFVQALVFSMLVTIYITVAISGHEEHH